MISAGAYRIQLGNQCGLGNTQKYFIGVGDRCGNNNTGNYFNGQGNACGSSNSGDYFNGAGYNCGTLNTGNYFNGFGYEAGYQNTGSYVLGLGDSAAYGNTLNKWFFIGKGDTLNSWICGYSGPGTKRIHLNGVTYVKNVNAATNDTIVFWEKGQLKYQLESDVNAGLLQGLDTTGIFANFTDGQWDTTGQVLTPKTVFSFDVTKNGFSIGNVKKVPFIDTNYFVGIYYKTPLGTFVNGIDSAIVGGVTAKGATLGYKSDDTLTHSYFTINEEKILFGALHGITTQTGSYFEIDSLSTKQYGNAYQFNGDYGTISETNYLGYGIKIHGWYYGATYPTGNTYQSIMSDIGGTTNYSITHDINNGLHVDSLSYFLTLRDESIMFGCNTTLLDSLESTYIYIDSLGKLYYKAQGSEAMTMAQSNVHIYNALLIDSISDYRSATQMTTNNQAFITFDNSDSTASAVLKVITMNDLETHGGVITLAAGDSLLISSNLAGKMWALSDSSAVGGNILTYGEVIFSVDGTRHLTVSQGDFSITDEVSHLVVLAWGQSIYIKNNFGATREIKYEVKY